MNMRVYFAAVSFAAFGHGALANGFPEWCLAAIESGDSAQAIKYAEMVLEGGREFDSVTVDQAKQCVKRAIGKDVVYIPETFEFITTQQLDARQQNAKAIEDARNLNTALAEERRARVLEKLREGCAEMYRRDQAAAITNAACFEHFLSAGLPE